MASFPDDPLVSEEDSGELRKKENTRLKNVVLDYVQQIDPELSDDQVFEAIDRSSQGGQRADSGLWIRLTVPKAFFGMISTPSLWPLFRMEGLCSAYWAARAYLFASVSRKAPADLFLWRSGVKERLCGLSRTLSNTEFR
jgi:hypothetical protein